MSVDQDEHVIPEMEDFEAIMREHGALSDTAPDEEVANRYRLAQAHKLIRLAQQVQPPSGEQPPAEAEGQPIPEPVLAAVKTNGDEEEEDAEEEEEEEKEEEKKDEAAQAS